MSIAGNPGKWYSSLRNYKHGSKNDHTLISALIAAFLTAHHHRIQAILGGTISHVVVVPSTRGRPFSEQPLVAAVKRSALFGARLLDGLTHIHGAAIAPQQYKPEAFTAYPKLVRGERIVLIEDLWVSGATAISGAGALLDAGAHSVVIVPVARQIRSDDGFCPTEYVHLTTSGYDVDAWPR